MNNAPSVETTTLSEVSRRSSGVALTWPCLDMYCKESEGDDNGRGQLSNGAAADEED